jgi:hypothetical protein
MLYSAGDCPVCSFTGELLLVMDHVSRRIFVYCPLCGCAWDKPPPPFTLDSIDGVEVFAPLGIEFPTREDIARAGLEHAIERNPDYAHWRAIMSDVLVYNHRHEAREGE